MKLNTRLAIQTSFHRLLRIRSLDRITVRDIVEDCGLTRNTFYYYYEDIYDLFDDYLDSRMKSVTEALSRDGSWEDALRKLLVDIFDGPRTGRHIFDSKKCDTLRRYIGKLIGVVAERYIAEQGLEKTVTAQDRKMVCDACCYALYGLLEQWLTGEDSSRFEELLDRLLRIFDGTLGTALCYCATHPEEKEAVQ